MSVSIFPIALFQHHRCELIKQVNFIRFTKRIIRLNKNWVCDWDVYFGKLFESFQLVWYRMPPKRWCNCVTAVEGVRFRLIQQHLAILVDPILGCTWRQSTPAVSVPTTAMMISSKKFDNFPSIRCLNSSPQSASRRLRWPTGIGRANPTRNGFQWKRTGGRWPTLQREWGNTTSTKAPRHCATYE